MNKLKIAQRSIEDKFSRHNIRAHVLEDLQNSKLSLVMGKTREGIKKYFHGIYYPSKAKRVQKLKSYAIISDLVIEMLIISTSEQKVQPIQAAAAKLANHLEGELFDTIRTASELLAVACLADMFDIIPAKNSETGSMMIKSRYRLEDETIQYISDTKYLPPLICTPNDITDNNCSGYLTKSESVILGNDNHHEEYQALDVLNISQNIELSLDQDVLNQEEKSKKPLDTPEKVDNYLRMVISSRDVYRDIVRSGNKFYFTWRFDKRGRMYSQGYHVNIQSTSYKKALINLANKQVITGAP